MYNGNPVYNMTPETAPGLEGFRNIAGNIIAPMVGGTAHPYVPPNQSTHDAWISKNVNTPLFDSMMSRQFGQLGYQFANTAANTPLAREMARMSGYDLTRMQSEMRGIGQDFGRSQIGRMVMPMLDTALAGAGITGGSFSEAASLAFNSRMNLLPPGTVMSPHDPWQQHRAMAGASAMMSELNGLMSRRDKNGHMTMLTDPAFTQGFDRSKITGLAMRVAQAGGFTGKGGGYIDRLQSAADGFDIENLDVTAGDFTGGGPDSNISGKTAQKVKKVHDAFRSQMTSVIQAMGAMRDMLKEVDGIEDKLTAMTGGSWLRSERGATEAKNSVRRLNAVMQAYDLNPNETWNRMMGTRDSLQAAMLGGQEQANVAKYYGFDGGGMFHLAAQTSLMSNVEDMITARGVRGDPIASDRLRKQSVQAMARNMNTQAGVAAQLLAYGRQTGVISESDAARFQEALTSGDRSVMSKGINEMLTLEFGSAKKGRALMQDQMFINSVRQSMNDEAGDYAMRTMMKGADREFMRQEKVIAASDRAAFTKDVMASLGMRVTPSDADVGRMVASVQATIGQDKDGGSDYAAAFGEQYAARVAKGMKPNAALQATLNAFKHNPATAKYSERIELAMNRQTAENNEYAIKNGGLESGQAKALSSALRSSGLIDSKQYAAIQKKLRGGDGAGALAMADSIVSGLSSSQQKLFGSVRAEAEKSYKSAVQTIDDKKTAEMLVDAAGKSGFASGAVVDSYNGVIDAAKAYLAGGRTSKGFERLQDELAKNKFSMIFGDEVSDKFLQDLKGPNAKEAIAAMGRQSMQLKQLAVKGLSSKGYDLNYSGFWGGGLYAGNSDAAAKARDSVISRIAGNIDEDSVKSAGDRSTLGADFVDWITGDKNWKEALKIYGANDKRLISMTEGYSKAFSAYEKAQEDFSKKQGAVSDAKRALSRANNFKDRRTLEDMVANIDNYTDKEISEFIDKNKGTLGDKSAEALKDALASRRDVAEKQKATQESLVEMSEKKEFTDVVKKLDSSKKREAKRKKRYDDIGSYMEGLDADKLAEEAAAVPSGDMRGYEKMFGKVSKNAEAYIAATKAVSDKEVADRLGYTSLEGADKGEIAETRMQITREKAEKGDKAAVDAMHKFEVASNEGTQRIRGEVVIKSGNEQYPATLTGNIGGLQ